MDLGSRKRLILQAIIEDYINTAEPVGSRKISKKYLTGTSSATIRNEMADLEDMGYIEQPHTSAGRIPSDKGYRLYVDTIMKQNTVNDAQNERIKQEFIDSVGEIDRLVKHASKLLSQMTQYTSIVLAPQLRRTRIRQIQLIRIDNATVLAVIITDAGIVKNSILRLAQDVQPDALIRITNMLNDKLTDLGMENEESFDIEDMLDNSAGYREIIEQIVPELIKTLLYSDTAEIYHDGVSNILNLPEYSDINKARDFLNAMEEKDLLFKVLNDIHNDMCICIGSENKIEQFRECSLIKATYKVSDKIIGSVGIIGPTRMEYSRAISIVECMTKNLSEMLTNILKK
ncbi:MAG TPA: heat-inducible transcriptional repressor HrcA [Bacillota bacterium]|nr:heat-inducible transcriptional repressor HrcA [Bacillota bacterium]HPL54551.1 heat-inducible transcriptional repressor HrcA [Bacillota bacterium]